jgi:WD40 repeat protein
MRGTLALLAFGFALAPARAADPQPVWDIDTFSDGKGIHDVRWVGFSPDGKTLVAQVLEGHGRTFPAEKHCLFTWNVATRKESLNQKLGDGPSAGSLMLANAMTKAGTVLLAGGYTGEVRLSDGKSSGTDNRGLSFSCVWCNGDSSAYLRLIHDGLHRCELVYSKRLPLAADPKMPLAREEWLNARLPGDWSGDQPTATATSDLSRLAVGSREKNLVLYAVSTEKELKFNEVATVTPTHRGAICSMRFSPDGKTLATADGSASVFLWDVAKAGKGWEPRATIPAGTFTVSALAFSPDGRTLAAGTFDTKGRPNLYVIDVVGGKLLGSYRLAGALTAVAYSPDSQTLVTGNSFGRIQLWDAEALRNP